MSKAQKTVIPTRSSMSQTIFLAKRIDITITPVIAPKPATARVMRTRQEIIERAVRFRLRHAMEIETRLYVDLAATQALGVAPVETRCCIMRKIGELLCAGGT